MKPDLNLGRPGLSVLPLGVGDAFSAIHHPTSMLVSQYQNPAWDNNFILIDCPQSIRKMMREADDGSYHGLDLQRIDTIILTHLHTDHASGLETLAAFFKIAVGRKPRLVALPEVLEGVPRFLEAISSLGTMYDLFEVGELDPEGTVKIGDTMYTVAAKKTQHPIATAALRISLGAQTLAYSCDTTFDQELWEWLWHDYPKMVIHEVGHGIHTNFEDIVKAMMKIDGARARIGISLWKKLRLTHYPDDLFPMLDAMPDVQILREGQLELL